MENKELRKLNRKELLEMLLEQRKHIEYLEKELESVNRKLNDREIMCRKAGTLAEASLKLSDIFKAADEAAYIYLKNIKEGKVEI